MFATVLAIVVGTLLVFVHAAGRISARRPGLGSVSQSWLAEERASESNRPSPGPGLDLKRLMT